MNNKLKAFDIVCKEARDIFESKNNDYGNDNIGALGERGVFVRIWDKVSRLRTLIWEERERKVKDETIEDTIKDLVNYAIIALILHRNQWK